jgi:hypothetical protein
VGLGTILQALLNFAVRLKGKRSPRFTFVPACQVYIRPDAIWIFPLDVRGRRKSGGIGLTAGPAEKLPSDASDRALGEAALAALSRSRFEEWDYKSPLPLDGAIRSSGFKTWNALEQGALHMSVFRKGDGIAGQAYRADKGGGYSSIEGTEKICPDDPTLIGLMIRQVSKHCIAKASKPRKRRDKPANPAAGSDSDSEDVPIPFGYKASWIAIRGATPQAVAGHLNLKDLDSCSWKQGLQKALTYKGLFISPVVDEWVLIIGNPPDAGQASFRPFLKELSKAFGDVFYFGTHRVVGYNAWAIARGGEIVRAFAYLGERGEFLLNVGDRLPEEIELATGLEDEDGAPNEETVLDLAAQLVFDPREIDAYTEAVGPGHFGCRDN